MLTFSSVTNLISAHIVSPCEVRRSTEATISQTSKMATISQTSKMFNNNNGPNGHLLYVGGDLMMRRGMLPIIMFPTGTCVLCCTVHIEETGVGWRNQLRMKTSAT